MQVYTCNCSIQEARDRRIPNSRSDRNPGSKRQTGCRGGSVLGAYTSLEESLEFSYQTNKQWVTTTCNSSSASSLTCPPPTGIEVIKNRSKFFLKAKTITNPKPIRKNVHTGTGEMAQSGSVCHANVRSRVLISRASSPLKKPGPAPSCNHSAGEGWVLRAHCPTGLGSERGCLKMKLKLRWRRWRKTPTSLPPPCGSDFGRTHAIAQVEGKPSFSSLA